MAIEQQPQMYFGIPPLVNSNNGNNIVDNTAGSSCAREMAVFGPAVPPTTTAATTTVKTNGKSTGKVRRGRNANNSKESAPDSAKVEAVPSVAQICENAREPQPQQFSTTANPKVLGAEYDVNSNGGMSAAASASGIPSTTSFGLTSRSPSVEFTPKMLRKNRNSRNKDSEEELGSIEDKEAERRTANNTRERLDF